MSSGKDSASFSLVLDNVFKNEDYKKIAKSCEKIRAVNTKKGENRKKYVQQFEKHFVIYKKLVKTVEELTEEIKENSNETKTSVREQVIGAIREKQEELEISSYLINVVKYSFIRTIVNWLNNPKELEKKSIYKPRSQSNKSKIILKEPEFELELLDKKKEDKQWKIIFQIKNKSNYPLQNLEIKVTDHSDERVHVTSVTGYLIEIAKGIMHIAFIPASMEKEELSAKFAFTTTEVEELEENFTLTITQDFPAKELVIKQTMTF
ncbi:MAG: hypothetical protein KAS63_09555 [Candidatus Heimdallarchaeota archaeon]|nr:hypothetical protein [Candidatus Heimdallarchaeota archaeon]MCK4955595.1 hypothetical protein [Candidatus Heimdallarchaeota archaeon]